MFCFYSEHTGHPTQHSLVYRHCTKFHQCHQISRRSSHLLFIRGMQCLQCFDAVGWAAGRASPVKTEWWGAGMVICLERVADLHMAQLMPQPLTVSYFSKIQTVLPFWYRLTGVVPDKGPLNARVGEPRSDLRLSPLSPSSIRPPWISGTGVSSVWMPHCGK